MALLVVEKLFVFFSLLLSVCWCELQVVEPNELQATIPVSTAMFGNPTFDGSIFARLVFVESDSTFCKDDYSDRLAPLMQGDSKIILLVDRGKCTFVDKTKVAEAAGVSGVIVGDAVPVQPAITRGNIENTIMADDGHGGSIRIPAMLIPQQDYSDLRSYLLNHKNSLPIYVRIDWTFPPSDLVSLDIWTDAAYNLANKFIDDFAQYAFIFKNRIHFTPHYHITALDPTMNDPLKMCWEDERGICAEPPGAESVSGRDVLKEDIRQLCLFEKSGGSSQSEAWWQYIGLFRKNCPLNSPNPDTRFGEVCSYKTMQQLDPPVNVDKIKACVERNPKERLKEQKDNRAWNIFAIRINQKRFSGTPDASSLAVAICQTFRNEPQECANQIYKQVKEQRIADGRQGTRSFTVGLFFFFLLFFVAGAALYMYQRYLQKSARASLRHEVMMEVKTQMQEYHELKDDAATDRSRQPLVS